MNLKIDKRLHESLQHKQINEYVVGSRLYGMATEDSDTDYLCFYEESKYLLEPFNLNQYLPNIHLFQYDCDETNSDYVWTTERQFFQNLMNGDSTVNIDCFLFCMNFHNKLSYVRTQKVLKCLVGYLKRDIRNIKDHPSTDKYRKHAARGIYMIEEIIENRLPDLDTIKNLDYNRTKVELNEIQKRLREKINHMYEAKEIERYFIPADPYRLRNMQYQANNTREFKYD